MNCKDAEIASKEYPFIIMGHVETLEEGAIFNANLLKLGQQDIISYGFIWNMSNDTEIENWFKKELNESIGLGSFSITINTDLLQNENYIVRPFIKTVENTILGPSVEFTSRGSKSPEVLDYFPKEGFDGAIVKLKGKFFSSRIQSTSVFVENTLAEIIRSTEDSLIFKIPESGFIGNAKFKIVVGDREFLIEKAFEVFGPEISAISKTEGHSGDIITIQGKNFTQNGEPKIYFNDYIAEIIETDEEMITAVVPVTNSFFNEYIANIRIVSGLKSRILENPFKINKSWESKSATPFDWPSVYNAFSFNNMGYILEVNSKRLYQYNPITDKWNESSTFPGDRDENNIFVTNNNKLFKIGGSNYLGPVKYFWEYDFLTQLWTQKDDIPFSFDHATNVRLNEDEYIITSTGQVWSYNYTSQLFSKKNDIPIQFHVFAFAFIENNNIFLTTYGSDWSYDLGSDTWREIAKNNFTKADYSKHAFGFYSNGSAYVLEDGKNLFKYYHKSGSWILSGKYPGCGGDTTYKTVFVIGDDAYIATTFGSISMCSPFLFVYRD